ncbi:MAG: neutral/alkaline non-lysosomal ceramidase N-terminal domain-containing protein, partial [Anaerolineae bacterium]|nr:neutral/alkaline non-lysosomal ceramidase N-terminal domain-containing protein [Anaerolineae bacterium]
MEQLAVGHGRAEITPRANVHMMGYAARTGLSLDVYDALWANAVALEADGGRLLILALDVASLDLDLVARLKATLGARTGLAPEEILTNTSHTHAGPMVASRPGLTYEAQYVQRLIAGCVEAAAAAWSDLQPAELAVGSAPLDIGLNRRERTPEGMITLGVNPEGARLAEVTVWRLARQDAPDVVLFSTPIHGTVMGAENRVLSSEWMGAAVRTLERMRPELRAVFLQGCAGNQNPYRDQRTYARVLKLGAATAKAVDGALDTLQTVRATPLRQVARELHLPTESGGDAPCPLHGVRLGEALLIGLGGEAFVEYALHVRARCGAASVMALGYTDGSVGYLPTASA